MKNYAVWYHLKRLILFIVILWNRFFSVLVFLVKLYCKNRGSYWISSEPLQKQGQPLHYCWLWTGISPRDIKDRLQIFLLSIETSIAPEISENLWLKKLSVKSLQRNVWYRNVQDYLFKITYYLQEGDVIPEKVQKIFIIMEIEQTQISYVPNWLGFMLMFLAVPFLGLLHSAF